MSEFLDIKQNIEDLEKRIEEIESYISESSFSGYYQFVFDDVVDMSSKSSILLGSIRPLTGMNKVEIILAYDCVASANTSSALMLGSSIISYGVITSSILGTTNFLLGNSVIDGSKSIWLNYDNSGLSGSLTKIRLFIKGDVNFIKNA